MDKTDGSTSGLKKCMLIAFLLILYCIFIVKICIKERRTLFIFLTFWTFVRSIKIIVKGEVKDYIVRLHKSKIAIIIIIIIALEIPICLVCWLNFLKIDYVSRTFVTMDNKLIKYDKYKLFF